MKKTICFFNSVKSWGGGEKWHLEMATYLRNKDYNVIVYCQKNGALHHKSIEADLEVRLIDIENLSFLNPFKIYNLVQMFKKDKPDILILNASKDIKTGAVAAKLAEVKKVVYRRGSAIPIKNTFLNRFYFKNVLTNMLANSEETKRTVNQNNPKLFPKENIKVIYNGIHFDNYHPIQDKPKTDTLIIGNLGRLEYQKNQQALLELAVVLKSKNLNFRLLIGGDGRLLNTLKTKAKDLNVEDVVDFKGYVEDVNAFMSQLDIFVLTSHWEGFGYVIAEASYHYKPVIAFDVSSNPEIIDNNKTGFLIEKDNIEELANKIILLHSQEELIKDMGRKGHDFVNQLFDAEVNNKKVEGYLESI
ncbi:glycosyltransferase [Wenyingzhuangia sp. chi5]|uniref:Glycosyltransferase n=1 Tax=Wenyingzhuangia gilva TaxID=3057677 RepID=A0ABT8VNB2_9FLAO|nr:glycosyltransferase [Wenyingzhuangia sp. chi5]MDO3693455.1 glycosyltransferase [Wenyingzhuangia sp. chi5]